MSVEPLYSVVRRSSNSRSLVTGEPETLAYGAEAAPLWKALVEASARNLLLGEAERDRWEVLDGEGETPSWDDVAACNVEEDAVEDFLVEVLGVSPAEAERLVA